MWLARLLLLVLTWFGLSFAVAQTVKTLADLPDDLVWETNDTAPTFASEQAITSGTYRLMTLDFPTTFRYVALHT